MQPLPDLTGQKFGLLTITRMTGFDENHHSLCLCRCDCGGEALLKAAEVQSGHVRSCGCLHKNRKPDLTGRRFGRLVAVRYAGKDSRNNRTYECLCDCGRTKTVAATQLTHGYIESCGCLLHEKRQENLKKAQEGSLKHGLTGTGTYRSWLGMVQRCLDTEHGAYPRYGKVGITVCAYLRENPTNLVALIGEKPTDTHSIDRHPNQKGSYTCGQCEECKTNGWSKNVRWATPEEQAVNRKSTVWVEIDGVRKTRAQAARDLGITYSKAVDLLKPYEVKAQSKVTFTPPPGAVPEGVAQGDSFDLVCSFLVEAGGTVCLTQMGDLKMPGYGGGATPKPSYNSEAQAMVAARPGAAGGDSGY